MQSADHMFIAASMIVSVASCALYITHCGAYSLAMAALRLATEVRKKGVAVTLSCSSFRVKAMLALIEYIASRVRLV
jgi:hypothetical protein